MDEDEEKLKELIVKAFDSIKRANKSLDESHEAVEKALNSITMVDKNLNVVHVNKAESGRYFAGDGQEVVKDKNGFFVVSETNEILRKIEELSENELWGILNIKLDAVLENKCT